MERLSGRSAVSISIAILCFMMGIGLLTHAQTTAGMIGRGIAITRDLQDGEEFANLQTIRVATPPRNADVITDWNTAALNAIRAGRTPPPIASRALAILHASIYDAVNGIDREHEAYFVRSAVPASASREAAASAAAHKVLVTLFPANAPSFDDLHTTTLAAIRNGPQKSAGIAWGESVADQILALRANDGSGATVPPPSGSGPGSWQPTPPAFAPYLLPQWGFVMPFAMTHSSQFHPPGPPALNSNTYGADYNEVKALGAAVGSARTPEQDLIALF